MNNRYEIKKLFFKYFVILLTKANPKSSKLQIIIVNLFHYFLICIMLYYIAGSISDRLALVNTDLYKDLEAGKANVPPRCKLQRSETKGGHFFIGDEIFPLTDYLVVPFARRYAFTDEEKNFNYRYTIFALFLYLNHIVKFINYNSSGAIFLKYFKSIHQLTTLLISGYSSNFYFNWCRPLEDICSCT